MTIANETLGKLIKDVSNLCIDCTYDEFVEKSKNIKETIDSLNSAIYYEIGYKDGEILFQKEIYDKINFPKVERIGKSGRIASIVGVCVVEVLCLILAIMGINGNLCTAISIISVFLFGGAYLGLTFWEVMKLSIRNKYNALKDSLEETKNTAEVLESIEGMFDYIHKYAVNKPEAFAKENKPKKPRSKKS
jgi:hypothetical protein